MRQDALSPLGESSILHNQFLTLFRYGGSSIRYIQVVDLVCLLIGPICYDVL